MGLSARAAPGRALEPKTLLHCHALSRPRAAVPAPP